MTDLLDDAGSVLVVDVTTEPEPREKAPRYNPDGFQLGVCRVCGVEAPTASSTYCDEHRSRAIRVATGASTDAGTPTTKVVPTAKVTPPPKSGKGAPTADEWNNRLFQKVVGALTDVMSSQLVRRYNLNDPDGSISDSLAMTNEEAASVAKPIGRYMAGTALNKRVGRKVLDNSDLLDAGFALYDWYDRVNKTLRGQQGQPLASVQPIRQPVTTPIEQSMGGEDVTTEPTNDGDSYPDGGFPPIHGGNFVI